MDRIAGLCVAVLWLLWLGYWWYSSRDTKATARAETRGSRASYAVLLIAAGYLMSVHRVPFTGTSVQMYEPGLVAAIAEVVGVAIGLGIAVWARRHLGRNWSGTVTTKDDHELVRSGPYRFVRHPIYTGIILAFIGMAVGTGTWTGVLAVAFVTLAFVRKLRLEERFMTEEFGDQYEQYRQQVRRPL